RSLIADVDVAVASGERHPSLVPNGDVLRAQAFSESLEADGGVVAAGRVVAKGDDADRCVPAACLIGHLRVDAQAGVVVAGGVVLESGDADSCVADAGRVAP